MNNLDKELECRARELLAYIDTELAVEKSLPFAVGYLVEQMRGLAKKNPPKRGLHDGDCNYALCFLRRAMNPSKPRPASSIA